MNPLRSRNRPRHATALPVRLRVGLWLGLFAMLAIYVGALLSQVRAGQSELPQWLTELACDHAGGQPASTAPAHHVPAFPLDACGYCSLLAASPALGNTALATSQIFLVTPEPERPIRLTLPAQPAPFPGARPRAPPLSS